MTANDLIAKYRACGPQALPVLLHFLADHVYAARLPGDVALRDASDFKAWLHDLGNAARVAEQPVTTEHRWNECPDCGHVHEGEDECGNHIGAGRLCMCERKVRA